MTRNFQSLRGSEGHHPASRLGLDRGLPRPRSSFVSDAAAISFFAFGSFAFGSLGQAPIWSSCTLTRWRSQSLA